MANGWTIATLDEECGDAFEEAYIANPNDDTVEILADVYECTEKQVRAVLKRRNAEEKAKEHGELSRHDHYRKHIADTKTIERMVNPILLSISGLFVFILLTYGYCVVTAPPAPPKSQIERAAEALCDNVRGGCK